MAESKKATSKKITKVKEEPKELITSASDITVNRGVAFNKGTAKVPAKPVKVKDPEEFIYNRSNAAVTIFKDGVKYIIPAKGKVRK